MTRLAGEMTLTSLPGGLSRWEAVQAMLKADTGKIEEAKHIQTEKIAAFILEPNSTGEASQSGYDLQCSFDAKLHF